MLGEGLRGGGRAPEEKKGSEGKYEMSHERSHSNLQMAGGWKETFRMMRTTHRELIQRWTGSMAQQHR
jgi:hypothetical protein